MATEKKNCEFTEADAREAIIRLSKEKGVIRARIIEKMLRLETNHFKSEQFKQTGSAGMEDGIWGKQLSKYFPNGHTVVYFKDNHPKERGTDKKLAFVVWPTVYEFAVFLNDYIDRHEGNYARWNSTNEQRQAEYRIRIGQIRARFV